MADPRVEKLAEILVDYSIDVKPGDWVVVRSHVLALPLLHEVTRRILRAGGNPTVVLSDSQLGEIMLREANDAQLQWISPMERMSLEEADALIVLNATDNTRALSGVEPQRQQLHQQARRDLMGTYMQRSAEGALRWVGTQYPCPALAQEADMSLGDYEDFVYSTTFADQPDPVQCWRDVHDRQQRWVDWMQGRQQMVIKGANAEMSLSIAGRSFINDYGRHNMPAGEIFTSPVEDSVNGWVRFTYPAIREGREVEGVEFYFEQGKIVKATARKNEAYLLSQLDADAGARFLGEWAIGTNYRIQRFTKSILYDEKIGGTMHMAVGRGFPEVGSRNASAIHWDFICDMRQESEIWVDGDLFYKNGEFQV